MLSSWKCYHHMMLPTCAPHEVPDLSPVKNGMIFQGGTSILARWTTDFDCGHETDFWYVVKNEPFDINVLKAKRRYEITKGLRNFDIRLIRATDHADILIDVIKMATREYPESYRPKVDREGCLHDFSEWESVQKDTARVYGAFSKKNGVLCGFAKVNANESYADYRMLKAKPESERLGINAALTYAILEDLAPRLAHGYYVCDGARNVSHETHFPDYLNKYFGFRRAYCNLHIAYRPPLGTIVQMMYPLRRLFSGSSKLGHKVKAVLAMEEMKRNCEKACKEHAKVFCADARIS